MTFWTKFAQKEYFYWKTKKENSIIEFCMFGLVLVPNFSLKWQFWCFGLNLPIKAISTQKRKKSEHHHWILHVQISVGTKFQLKVTILMFWTKFGQKGYFYSKTKKMNITIEFCMFELLLVPNFSLKWHFWFVGPNLPKKCISTQNSKNWTSPLDYGCSN